MAKIQRLRELAQARGDGAKVERINALERRQKALHDRRVASIRNGMGSDAFEARRAALAEKKAARAARVRGNSDSAPGRVDPGRSGAVRRGGDAVNRPNAPRVNAPSNTTIRRPSMDARTGPSVGTPSRPNAGRAPARPNAGQRAAGHASRAVAHGAGSRDSASSVPSDAREHRAREPRRVAAARPGADERVKR